MKLLWQVSESDLERQLNMMSVILDKHKSQVSLEDIYYNMWLFSDISPY